ncbi:acyltransferase [Paenibacillus sp. URB8-2]|nr:acyltransferase [Paenibacillus sp. URB8-2]
MEDRGETFFLNLRFMLIVTVFVGNAIEPITPEMGGLHSLYLWIFSFHMPLFVLVTGYFAKNSLTGAAGRKLLLQISMQYLIFQSLYSLLDATVFRVGGIHHSFFAPYLLLWFLASHAMWRLLLLGMRRWKAPCQLAFAAAAGIAVGYLPVDGIWFSISRTFVYLPFFIIGYHLSFAAVARLFVPGVKIAAALFSAVLLAILSTGAAGNIPAGWLYGSMTYTQLGAEHWYAGLYRLALYGLQLASSLAFLGLVPLREGRMTSLGRRTLYVFLLHGLIVRFAAASGIYSYLSNPAGAVLVPAAAVLLTLLLAQPFVKSALHPLVEPGIEPVLSLHRMLHRPLHRLLRRPASKPAANDQ